MPVPARVTRAVRWHSPLLGLAAASAVLMLTALVAMLFDDRRLLGAPVWMKEFKFGVSVAVYAVTMAWLLAVQTRGRRFGWWLGTVVAVTLSIEMFLLTVQVVRGEPSHFGHRSAWQDQVSNMMGGAIMAFLAAFIVLALLLAFQRLADPATRSAIRAGLALSIAGMVSGFLMFSNVTPEQVARTKRDEPTLLGGHSVGVPDGGAGMPVTYWSTTGGDLRIPHFVGIHALQLLPLLAFGLLMLARRRGLFGDERLRVHLVRIGSAGYAGLFGLVLWQALRGQPLLAPDAATLAALGGLLALTGAAAATAAGAARRRAHRDLSDSLADSRYTPIGG